MDSNEVSRAKAREHFLRTLNHVNGNQGTFTLHGKTTVTATFGCSNGDLKHFYVTDLVTPIGTYKHSILRVNDIISVEFPLTDKLRTHLCSSK